MQTRFRILWDADSLYIGIECDDSEPVSANLSRRDRFVDGDRIDIDLETTLDGRTAYHFSIYAAGQQLDGLHFNDNNMSTDWDAAWESAVARTPAGWSAELRIPLRVLRIPEHATRFGLQVARILMRRHEESHWMFAPKDTAGYVSTQMGTLTGLDGIKPVRELELRPYLAARAVRSVPALAQFALPPQLDSCGSFGVTHVGNGALCAGLDARIGLTSDLALIATVNPDFGQVEADQRVLNLSTFETFFPEKRPFFLEGLELYQPPVRSQFGGNYGGDAFQLFYSRRIGRPPELPVDENGNTFTPVYEPSARPVLTAFKLSGSLGSSTVGLLTALEPRVSAQILDGNGGLIDRRVGEAQNSAVARIRSPLGDFGLVGATATSLDPIFAGGSRHAHAGGVDLNLFDGKHEWNLQAQLAGSALNGGAPAVQRDGTVWGDGSTGAAGTLKLSKEAGSVIAILQADELSPEFTTNELGFMRRSNLFRTLGALQYRDVHPGAYFQSYSVTLAARAIRNAALTGLLYNEASLEGGFTLNSFWGFGGGLQGTTRGYDDREVQDGTPFERAGGFTAWLYGNTDTRKPLNLSFYAQSGRTEDAGFVAHQPNATITAVVRPHPQLETQLDLGYQITTRDVRNIRTASVPGGGGALFDPASARQHERIYLFAPQDARALSATLRGTLAFSPTLTLQAYAQLFTAGVSYGAPLRAQVAPGSGRIRLADLSPALAADAAPNADDRQAGLNVNLILRWEWRLGSTLYLVYSHASANDLVPPSHGLDFTKELASVAQTGAVHGDTVLVKIDLLKAL